MFSSLPDRNRKLKIRHQCGGVDTSAYESAGNAVIRELF